MLVFPVQLDRLAGVPDGPDMLVPAVGMRDSHVRIVVRALLLVRGARTVGPLRIEPGQDTRNPIPEEAAVLLQRHVHLVGTLGDEPAPLDLVVAAPEGQAGMVAQTAHLLRDLRLHIPGKLLDLDRVGRAGEHEILPHAEAQLVAEVIEDVRLVNSAAPYANHVHVGIGRRLEQRPRQGRRHPRRQRVGRHPVGALREERHAIDLEAERLAPAVGLADQFQRAQSDPAVLTVDHVARGIGQFNHQFVEGLRPQIPRPPQLRIPNLQFRTGAAAAQGRLPGRDHGALERQSCPCAERRPGGPLRRDGHRERHLPPGVPLDDLHIGQAPRVESVQVDRAPDAARGDRGGPIPPEAVRRLAHMAERMNLPRRVRILYLPHLLLTPDVI